LCNKIRKTKTAKAKKIYSHEKNKTKNFKTPEKTTKKNKHKK